MLFLSALRPVVELSQKFDWRDRSILNFPAGIVVQIVERLHAPCTADKWNTKAATKKGTTTNACEGEGATVSRVALALLNYLAANTHTHTATHTRRQFCYFRLLLFLFCSRDRGAHKEVHGWGGLTRGNTSKKVLSETGSDAVGKLAIQ